MKFFDEDSNLERTRKTDIQGSLKKGRKEGDMMIPNSLARATFHTIVIQATAARAAQPTQQYSKTFQNNKTHAQ